MAAFIENIEPFYGTGIKNELGQTLEEFLEEYNPLKYKNPCSTADIIVIRSQGKVESVNQGLKVLMIKRRNHPSIGRFALPGGFVEIKEDLIDAARRELTEETGLCNIEMEQMYTWGEVWRDPRTRIITTSYLAIVDDFVAQVKAGDDAADALWMDISLKKVESERLDFSNVERMRDMYELVVSNQEKKLNFYSIVSVSYNITGILKETEYEVIKNDEIAFDHPRMIVQALLYIKENL
ncbi:MAG: NUDIX domain-containing protein [Velocimicrobium sp.]